MCGLVGAAGSLQAKDDTTIKRLLMLDYFRGPDSTGLASIRGSGEVRIAKLANTPPVLFDSNQFKKVVEGISRCFIGHNRASTMGATNDFNAHPYLFGDIVGAHNGTLDQMSWARLEEAIGHKTNVDSQALIEAINKVGIEEAIALCTTGSDPNRGAWSLTWYDLNDGSLNFLRNKHRPMWYAFAKDYRRIYWASEWWMLEAAGHADGIEFAAEGDKGYRFFPTDEDLWYKFDVGVMVTATEKHKPKVKAVKGREPMQAATSGSTDPFGRSGTACMGFHPSGTHTPSSKTSTTTSRGTKSKSGTNTSSGNVLHWYGTKSHPYAGYIDEEKFEQLAKYGCTWCSQTVEYGDPGVTVFESDQLVLCGPCSGHHDAKDDTPSRIYVSPTEFVKLS